MSPLVTVILMKFNSLYGSHHVHETCTGSPVVVDYELFYDDSGVQELRPCGETDLYSAIQSHRESVDINILMERFRNGQVDILNRVEGFFADVTGIPTNYAEVLNLNDRASKLFDSFDPAIKARFNNSFTEFLCADSSLLNEVFNSRVVPDAPDVSETLEPSAQSPQLSVEPVKSTLEEV